ncbi:MAG: hypothetical protein J5615_08695 [Fibrobacter sp.]|uniref:hypothetical protein n=1 Tax=uncultured Fibrobacter sp. TaxID=261512 RepID=UPI00260BA43D|nr:hypothetical protein [uncultured Fibrobacter sp.]MBO4713949.1 hypothetical protein [Fibrobacter sp.]
MNYLGLDYGDELSYCFFANDCERYGRHYEWSAAVDSWILTQRPWQSISHPTFF